MYLTIITTVLVITQIIRVTQNAISLYRQERDIKRQLSWLKDRDITQEDFDIQREVFRLLRDKLMNEDD